jgi:hypothetical protein
LAFAAAGTTVLSDEAPPNDWMKRLFDKPRTGKNDIVYERPRTGVFENPDDGKRYVYVAYFCKGHSGMCGLNWGRTVRLCSIETGAALSVYDFSDEGKSDLFPPQLHWTAL